MPYREVTLWIGGTQLILKLDYHKTLQYIEQYLRTPEGKNVVYTMSGGIPFNLSPNQKLSFHYNKYSADESLKQYRINQFNPNKRTIFFVKVHYNSANISGPISIPQTNQLQPPVVKNLGTGNSNSLLVSNESINAPKMLKFQIIGDVERIRSIQVEPTKTVAEMYMLLFEGKKFSKVSYFTEDGTALKVEAKLVKDTELWRTNGLIMAHNNHNAA